MPAVLQVSDDSNPLYIESCQALDHSTEFAKDTLLKDHWCGWVLSNSTVTAEWIFLQYILGREISQDDREGFLKYFKLSQRADGSWSIATQTTTEGNISCTVEAYLALKILGISPKEDYMVRARDYVRSHGGAEKMRMLSRFHLAMFGLVPWASVPQMPPELIFLPSWALINVYKFASWARASIVGLCVLRVYEPLYALPNGRDADNDYIDELWLDPSEKVLPYTKPYMQLIRTSPLGILFQLGDLFLWFLSFLGFWFLRRRAISACTTWILERQETSGDWAGIYPPMHNNILVLMLRGLSQDDPVIQGALAACERFLAEDPSHGKWMQPSVSPVWDTFLMIRALADANLTHKDDKLLAKPVEWVLAQQIDDDHIGDWRIYRPNIPAGGFAFEYFNKWYPDVDDTAVGVVALLRHDPALVNDPKMLMAAAWTVGMQNRDSGWAAFDADNDAYYLHATPFSDMDSLCDSSTPDVTAHVLEMLGLMYRLQRQGKVKNPEMLTFLSQSRPACDRGLAYLLNSQEAFGGWYGRWGVNYIFGTSAAVCAMAYFKDRKGVSGKMASGVEWLRSRQNPDGGWGELLESYDDKALAGRGRSTPSQTAWALQALLELEDPRGKVVESGVNWLLRHQVTSASKKSGLVSATWPEEDFTATGFPGHFYLKYELYSHYFPMMALGRYKSAIKESS
ncbi:uncharacterized protein PgNI_08500 [Pyricularia grisea]|uniref:Terpene cyclase/mutase family member n=1 Tax=Pyricularia grisea TaxID=148305 RepID=A0A6P8AU21_PYRGI|nr:uncharacterized protein PgNI_08500 [Pyricularia grisea]TLD05707.1 hypothetical protein PgNI_08500 [Pyricularia grisea]